MHSTSDFFSSMENIFSEAAYNEMIEQQLQDLDGDTSKIYALLKANNKEIQEINAKITDLEHKFMEVKNG